MTLALDTSALLARHLAVPMRDVVLAACADDPDWCCSAAALAEALAAIPRLTEDPDVAHAVERSLREDVERFAVVPVDAACLARATQLSREQPIRLAHAVHLAAAERLPSPVRFCTFDADQFPVAIALGFEVISA
jgi:predicted nucleic acid-binding protein